MTTVSSEAPPTERKPLNAVYSPVISAGVLATLARSSEMAFGQEVNIFEGNFRLQLLRLMEVNAFGNADSPKLNHLKSALRELFPDRQTEPAENIRTNGFRVQSTSFSEKKLLLMKVIPSQHLMAEREAIRRVVRNCTELDIAPAEDLHWNIVVGTTNQDTVISTSDLDKHIGQKIPTYVTLAHPVASL